MCVCVFVLRKEDEHFARRRRQERERALVLDERGGKKKGGERLDYDDVHVNRLLPLLLTVLVLSTVAAQTV